MVETTARACAVCSDGQVRPIAEKGRMAVHHGTRLEIPEDVSIPTCSACGERFYDEETSARVDKGLDHALDEIRFDVLKNALEMLERLTTRNKLEVMLDLSPGYLGKLLKRTKKVGHRTAMLLDFIAKQRGGLEHAASVFEREAASASLGNSARVVSNSTTDNEGLYLTEGSSVQTAFNEPASQMH